MSKTPSSKNKRQSVAQANTLFNYFSSPKTSSSNSTPKKESNTSSASLGGAGDGESNNKCSDSEDEIVVSKSKKRSRIALPSDSESENEFPNNQSKKKRQKLESESESDYDDSPPRKRKTAKKPVESSKGKSRKKTGQNGTGTGSINGTTDTSSSSSNKGNDGGSKSQGAVHTNWLHNGLDFLQPSNIRDSQKRRPNEPDYDPRTLFVPQKYLDSLTPGMRQWWLLKSKHMDSMLFFKVGKFYELYHMDAVQGVQLLGLSYMRGEFAHSGFPETAYSKMAGALLEKGVKVARVEQTETPEMMNERIQRGPSRPTKWDKVVRREICQISTKATCLYTAQMPEGGRRDEDGCWLYAVKEKLLKDGNIRFGVAFLDTSLGEFYLSEFDDDKQCSRLLALLTEYSPGLVLLERGKISTTAHSIVKKYFSDTQKDFLTTGTQFYNASTTLEKLSTGNYFTDKEDKFRWPDFFKQMADECLPKEKFELALSCLGAIVWYLKDSEIDVQVLSMGKWNWYEPIDVSKGKGGTSVQKEYMVLDAVTLKNLSLLGGRGSLQKTLDHCQTAFGKRLLQQWICRPLCNVTKITERQKAVKELHDCSDLLKTTRDLLKQLPNLEHQLAKIHCYGNKFCAENHPDGRAIFYEQKTYSKRKILDLIKTIKGFEAVQAVPDLFKDCQSRLLRKITQLQPDGMYVDLSKTIAFFKEAFDQEEAAREGRIVPKAGVDEAYDGSQARIAEVQRELDEYLEEQREHFGARVTYFGTDRKRYQLEVPEGRANRATEEHRLEGHRKGVCKRYTTARTRELLQEMTQAENERGKVIADLNRRIFCKFSDRHEEWEQVIHCLTILDVLCSLSYYARSYSQDICQPEIKPFDDEHPTLFVTNARHPTVPDPDSFVPNTIHLSPASNPPLLILTGPNMGGKSTLMRTAALITLMAQMGAHVPANYCQLSLVDRVFTRLGARDDIVGGLSTFMVELQEACVVLRHATRGSMVLLDELGRGTSTFDGMAIATGYVRKLGEIGCRSIFSTHYHSLVDRFIGSPHIQLGHMACLVERDDSQEEPSEETGQECVTFLYKLSDGRCPKSFGFHAARLAGLPGDVVMRGRQVAAELDKQARDRRAMEKVFTGGTEEIREIVRALKQIGETKLPTKREALPKTDRSYRSK